MNRTLVLRREQLADLAPADLSAVAGAAASKPCPPDHTYHCLTILGCELTSLTNRCV